MTQIGQVLRRREGFTGSTKWLAIRGLSLCMRRGAGRIDSSARTSNSRTNRNYNIIQTAPLPDLSPTVRRSGPLQMHSCVLQKPPQK
jgi:hypothetical protein